jgi:hypothetical protein
MRTPAIPIVFMLAAGAASALYLPDGALPWFAAGAVAAWQLALLAFVLSRVCLFTAAALASVALAAAASASHADWARSFSKASSWRMRRSAKAAARRFKSGFAACSVAQGRSTSTAGSR